VRCPARSIAALATHNNFSRAFLEVAAGVDPKLSPPCAWAAKAWVSWNAHVERYADARIRIEDYQSPIEVAHAICAAAGMDCSGGNVPALPSSPRWNLREILGLAKSRSMRHHRRHTECDANEMVAADPDTAAQVKSH
jgi:hypothetical protein